MFLHFDRPAAGLRTAESRTPRAEFLAFTTREGEGDEWSNRYLDLPRHFTMWQEQPLRDLLTGAGWNVAGLAAPANPSISGWFYVLASRAVIRAGQVVLLSDEGSR